MEALNQIIVTQIMPPVTVQSQKGKQIHMRNRRSCGLSLCISGRIAYEMDGRTYLSEPGTAVLLPKGCSYRLYGEKDGLFPLINFQCQNLDLDTIVVLPLHNPSSCLKDFETISNLFLFRENMLRVLGAFYDLLSNIYAQQQPQDHRLQPALRYLEANIGDPTLSNDDLAAQIGTSEVYLRRLFTARFNRTPKQYILDLRIRKAKQLLSDTTTSVTAIAEACGFSSVYHFCRAFKQQTGATPTQFAENNRFFGL